VRYKGLDLNLLHVLDILLEVKNVTRAADRLALSQSAVSAALSRLREFFGDELFVLEGRKLLPTAFAEQLSRNLHACLQEADTIINASKDFEPASSQRTFRILAADYIFASILTDVSESIAKRASGITLEFVGLDRNAPERIERGDIDLIIGPREYLLTGHPIRPLFEEDVVVAGWSRNAAFLAPLTEDAFFQAGHVAVRHGIHSDATFADRYIDNVRQSRRVEAVAPAFTLVPWMLIGTARLALIPRHLAEKFARYVPIKHVPPPFPVPKIAELAQFHRTKASDKGIEWLINEMIKAA
jgi:LysR family transcriptional regulator, nod-box dependent transcriptional activator